jgi:hypothetical protein
MITLPCIHCGGHVVVDTASIGQEIYCTQCGKTSRIPIGASLWHRPSPVSSGDRFTAGLLLVIFLLLAGGLWLFSLWMTSAFRGLDKPVIPQ